MSHLNTKSVKSNLDTYMKHNTIVLIVICVSCYAAFANAFVAKVLYADAAYDENGSFIGFDSIFCNYNDAAPYGWTHAANLLEQLSGLELQCDTVIGARESDLEVLNFVIKCNNDTLMLSQDGRLGNFNTDILGFGNKYQRASAELFYNTVLSWDIKRLEQLINCSSSEPFPTMEVFRIIFRNNIVSKCEIYRFYSSIIWYDCDKPLPSPALIANRLKNKPKKIFYTANEFSAEYNAIVNKISEIERTEGKQAVQLFLDINFEALFSPFPYYYFTAHDIAVFYAYLNFASKIEPDYYSEMVANHLGYTKDIFKSLSPWLDTLENKDRTRILERWAYLVAYQRCEEAQETEDPLQSIHDRMELLDSQLLDLCSAHGVKIERNGSCLNIGRLKFKCICDK